MKLNVDDLSVSSFETEPLSSLNQPDQGFTTGTTTDPTAATWCYICPQETYNSCYYVCPEQPY